MNQKNQKNQKNLSVGQKSGETLSGVVKWFNGDKGFGFITSNKGDEFFAHISKVENKQALQEGQNVSFKVMSTFKGLQATDIVIEE